MLPFIIRQYQPADHEKVANLHILALKNIYAYVENGELDKDLDDIEGNYLKNDGEFLVGMIGNQIIAMGALRRINNDVAEIKRMRVNPDFQRRGYGQRILIDLEKRAKELEYKTIQLDTTVKETGQYLYRKNGYTEFKREKEGRIHETIFFRKKI